MNPKVFLSLLVFVVCVASESVFSWSKQGHSAQGRVIYAQLSKKEQAYYAQLTADFSGGKIQFHDLSQWVDFIRNQSLQEIFAGDIPSELLRFQAGNKSSGALSQSKIQSLSRRNTSSWHYSNQFYYKPNTSHQCRLRNTGKLDQALVAVDKALKENPTPRQEIILIAFMIHLLEDGHQPLHTIAYVAPNCEHDRGGNNYCLHNLSGSCMLNLHQLWDQGFGVFADSAVMKNITVKKQQPRPLSATATLLLAEGKLLAPKIYKTEPNRAPHRNYMEWAKETTQEQLTKSVQRVTQYLKSHYERKLKK